MPARSTFGHYSMVAAAVAVLGGLVYIQMSDYLPETLQMSGPDAARQQNPACALAEVPRHHTFVAASAWEGGLPTDLVIGNPPMVLKTVRVSIDQGEKPITLFLSGYHVIFDFAGDVGRVARIVAMSPIVDRRIGIAGIPAERIEFPKNADCKLFDEAIRGEAMARTKALAVMFGRRPDHDAKQHKVVQLSLPVASFEPRPEQVNAPRGPRTLDPAHIVSALPITRPELLPGEDGIAQLEAAGALRRPSAEEVEEFILGVSRPYQSKLSPDFRLAIKFDYVVTRETTLPQPPSMKQWGFLVLAGVPAPRLPGRVCIAQMDGFQVNDAYACLGEAREGIEALRDLPSVEKVAHCHLLKIPEQASLEAVSTYQPETGNRSLSAKRTPYPIDVQVEKAGDVVLVLNSYEPAIWRLSASPHTRIKGVLLVGHYPSMVEGVPDEKVISDVLEGNPDRAKPAPGCAPMRAWHSSAYRGGPDALVFDRQLLALTGRNLDGLRGAYKLKTVEVR
jgi:hypothetical protein